MSATGTTISFILQVNFQGVDVCLVSRQLLLGHPYVAASNVKNEYIESVLRQIFAIMGDVNMMEQYATGYQQS